MRVFAYNGLMITLRFEPIKSINEAYIGTWLPTMKKSEERDRERERKRNNRRMNYLWITLFELFDLTVSMCVYFENESIDFDWHTAGKKREKNRNKISRMVTRKKQEMRRCNKINKSRDLFEAKRKNQAIICYRSSVPLKFPWKMITCAFVQVTQPAAAARLQTTACWIKYTSMRLHIIGAMNAVIRVLFCLLL